MRVPDYPRGMNTAPRLTVLFATFALVACDSAGTRGVGGGGGTRTSTNTGNNNNNNNNANVSAARSWCNSVISAAARSYASCFGGPASYYSDNLFASGGSVCDEYIVKLMAGRRIYNATLAQQCTAAISSWDCSDSLDACERAMGGAVAPGAACGSGDCVEGTYCEIPNDTCEGSCLNGNLTAGMECQDSRACADGLTCMSGSGSGMPRTCELLAGVNQTCEWTGDCADSLWCNNSVCATPKSAGSSCESSFRECQSGLTCAGPSGARACRTPKKVGENCSGGHRECTFGYCATDGKCTLTGVAGDACGDLGGAEMAGCLNSWCSADTGAGTCMARRAAGQPCTDFDECEGSCDNGTCVADRCD